MLTIIKKDIATITTGVLLHGCNCMGGFGSGIAGVIARTWPTVRERYIEYVTNHHGSGGDPEALLGTYQAVAASDKLLIFNCFTQLHYGADGKRYASPEAIRSALTGAFQVIDDRLAERPNTPDDQRTVYMPQIGCGLGGLSWTDDVEPIVKELYLDRPRLFHLSIVTL
jgi:O-acetyl-ADP-ribose deacetylase (regulator of RNase III)